MSKIEWKSEKRLLKDLRASRITTQCKYCSKSFLSYPYHNRLFCSKDCYSKWQLIHPESTRNRGTVDLICEQCQNPFKLNMSTHSARIKASSKLNNKLNFCSRNCSEQYFRLHIYDWRNDSKGDNNPAWRGGFSRKRARIESTKAYQEFRKKVFSRDKNKCRICGVNERLEIHHIVPFNQDQLLFLEVSNAITLCDKHHNQTKYKEHLYINIFNEVLNAN